MTQIAAIDIGGTHARFALAEVAGGRVVSLDEPVTLRTAEHGSFQTAWEEFAWACDSPLPRAAAIAIAAPVSPSSPTRRNRRPHSAADKHNIRRKLVAVRPITRMHTDITLGSVCPYGD